MRLYKAAIVIVISTGLGGCAKVMPQSYINYDGSDAATFYVLNQQGNVGTLFLDSYVYNSRKNCYGLADRYQLDSNFFKAKGNVVVAKVEPGTFYSVSQIRNGASSLLYSHSSLIPEPGKYYYISSGSIAVQVPESFVPSATVNADDVVKTYAKNDVNYWDVRKICKSRLWTFY